MCCMQVWKLIILLLLLSVGSFIQSSYGSFSLFVPLERKRKKNEIEQRQRRDQRTHTHQYCHTIKCEPYVRVFEVWWAMRIIIKIHVQMYDNQRIITLQINNVWKRSEKKKKTITILLYIPLHHCTRDCKPIAHVSTQAHTVLWNGNEKEREEDRFSFAHRWRVQTEKWKQYGNDSKCRRRHWRKLPVVIVAAHTSSLRPIIGTVYYNSLRSLTHLHLIG